jgi:perosamine synthetase
MIDLFKPCMGNEELESLRDIFKSGWIGLGPKTEQFEKEFAEYIGCEYAVGVNSATAALDLSLKLLNINHGDEVIVPTITFVSTAHVVRYNMAEPIFADVDNDLLIDLEDVARKITKRTKAIIPVHYSGRPVDMDRLKDIANGIPIVEDAAHAAGAVYNGRRCGNLGTMGAFSFHAVKNLAMGDGGAITTNDKELYERAKKLRWLGIDKSTWVRSDQNRSYWWEYSVDEIGLKCHMNDISASIGLVQLSKLDGMNAQRKEIAERYTAGLIGVKTPMMDTDDSKSSWHIYCVRSKRRNDLSVYLKDKGIMTGVHYKPIHLYKCYGNIPTLPNAEKCFEEILSLPMHPGLTNNEIDTVIEAINSF